MELNISIETPLFHIGAFPFKKKKQKKQKKRNTIPGEPVHPGILDRFARVMQAVSSGNPVDLGSPLPGTIRIVVPSYYSTNYDAVINGQWLHNTIHSHDRTIAEWRELIRRQREPLFPGSTTLPYIRDAFSYLKDHADEMERIVYKNLRIRRFFRFWLASARKRIMNRRTVGDVDLYTMNPIPEQFRVQVCDVPTRTTYVFHVNTILRTFVSSLSYNSFGISSPQVPKNPYTNVPWTIGQLIAIIEQCVYHKIRAHSFLPFLAQIYRESGYDIKKMYTNNTSSLNIAAARSYFSNHIDPDVIEMYLEVYDDLEQLIPNKKNLWFLVKRKLELRSLSAELMKRWDDIILTYWIFQTYRYVLSPSMKPIHEVDEDLITLYNETCTWWSKQPKRSIRKRASPTPTSAPDEIVLSETITHV